MEIYNKFRILLETTSPMALLGSDGSCSCGELELFGLKITSHCWRGSRRCSCKYSGIHVEDSQNLGYTFSAGELLCIGNLFAEYIRKAYNTEVTVVASISK